jgi:hypothetical protein
MLTFEGGIGINLRNQHAGLSSHVLQFSICLDWHTQFYIHMLHLLVLDLVWVVPYLGSQPWISKHCLKLACVWVPCIWHIHPPPHDQGGDLLDHFQYDLPVLLVSKSISIPLLFLCKEG